MDPPDPRATASLQVTAAAGRRSIGRPTTPILPIEKISVNESRLWLLDLAWREELLMSRQLRRDGFVHPPRFSKDGASLFVSRTRTASSSVSRRSISRERRERRLCSHPWDVEAMEPSPDGSRVAFVSMRPARPDCTCLT